MKRKWSARVHLQTRKWIRMPRSQPIRSFHVQSASGATFRSRLIKLQNKCHAILALDLINIDYDLQYELRTQNVESTKTVPLQRKSKRLEQCSALLSTAVLYALNTSMNPKTICTLESGLPRVVAAQHASCSAKNGKCSLPSKLSARSDSDKPRVVAFERVFTLITSNI